MFSGLFFTSFLAVLIIISQRKEIEFGVNFYDYNTCHILTFNMSHTDIIKILSVCDIVGIKYLAEKSCIS